jgi:hypothetical protein
MKKLAFILIMLLPLFSWAQATELNKMFDRYSGQEGFTSLHITRHLFELFKKVETAQQGKEFDEAVTSLRSIKLLVADSTTHAAMNRTLVRDILTSLKRDNYSELMVFQQNGRETITVLIREEGPVIKEFLMTIDSPKEAVFIFLEGNIDLEKISRLSRTMNIEGFEHLEKIDQQQ